METFEKELHKKSNSSGILGKMLCHHASGDTLSK